MSTTQDPTRTNEHRLAVTAEADVLHPSVSGECSCGWVVTARPNSSIRDESTRLTAFSPGEARRTIASEHRKHLELVRLGEPKTHRGAGLIDLSLYASLAIFLVAVAVDALAHGVLLGLLVVLGFAAAGFLGWVIARSRS